MKPLPLFFLLFPVLLHSQPFSAIDEYCLNTPNSRSRTVEKLAQHLSEVTGNEVEKLRAVYAWVTLHIQYEDNYPTDNFWATPEYIREQSPEVVLHNKTAICQGYANLFCAMAHALGLPCEVVTGIVKDADGSIPSLGHAWVVAKADGQWRLCDPTWGVPPAGSRAYTVTEAYFMAPPERFVFNHLPDDPAWQLLHKPVSERMFQSSGNAAITAYLKDAPDEVFAYQDTLEQWLAMDEVHRMLHMENRVLQFNGSNERALFSLGQNYWGLFYNLHRVLDSLADETILKDTVRFDTPWFLAQTTLLEKYHSRARTLFARLESPERLALAEKFYTPEDVATLLHHLVGAMWTGQFEMAFHRKAENRLASELDTLRMLIARADSAYALAEQHLDPKKMYATSLEIWHNRSLVYIQMAQREVFILERILNEKQMSNVSKTRSFLDTEARYFFQKAAVEVHQMTLKPPVYQLTRERQTSILQGLFALRSCELRARRAEIMPALEQMIGSQPFPVQQAETMLKNLANIQSGLYQFIDSVENNSASLGQEYVQDLLFNLQYETFALQYNLGSLQYRKAWHVWQQARTNNTMSGEKDNIRAAVSQVFSATREAQSALNAVARLGNLSKAHIDQRRQQINKLADSAQQLLDAL